CSIFAVSLCCLVWCYCLSLCFFFSYVDPSDLHSFPTRRSSDLPARSLLGACRVTTFSSLGFTSTESSFLGSLAELSYNSTVPPRSEEHTSELQSRFDLVCRLLLEKKKEHKDRTRAAQMIYRHSR